MQATLQEAAGWCGATYGEASGGTRLAGVSTDTRSLKPGQLFVPLSGERFDGHDYLDAAREAGAAASLWQRNRPVPPNPGLPLLLVDDTLVALQRLAQGYLETMNAKVAAVTGSNGKTTTKDLVSAVLATRLRVHKTEGNFNNEIGLPLTILRANPDTEAFVLEMGMSGFGEISLLTRLARPDLAVITNIGESHLLQLGSRRNIARAKLEIAEGLKPGGLLIVNGDEPLLAEELARMPLPPGVSVFTYGEGESCDYAASDVRVSAERTGFSVRTRSGGEPESYEIPVPGKHNALNALAAVAAGKAFGLTRGEIAEGLRAARLTGMRVERSNAANGAVILNDAYNASPTSVRAAIGLMSGLSGYRNKRLVLGDMLELGPDEAAYHAEIGRAVTPDAADYVYVYGPLSVHIAEEARGAYPPGAVRHFSDKRELMDTLVRETEPADLVLVKGSRGMKLEEIVAALQKGDAR
ncbi:UDP-N-acetylmuramoyl-tripeptide--D-alanyl-D-alanine ligase [Cohnella sp. CFH 77786]|uniref:UDP-N-acetylmuramoyl-tripeptide--D-alanyl-D- alanine ligase n=1 Tax=Cohnella sp. CFH 77786 TaxID=2662265 RepID=UPI00210540C6|nr:UDP-N-acetylmuramoyl-tripeptide--D-alanyl-D-alanine ligase [Cohnella sp. CFH 77786]